MNTTAWIILVVGAAIAIAAFVAARRSIIPATFPWLVVLITVMAVIHYTLEPGPVWGWVWVVLAVIVLAACLLHFVLGTALMAIAAIIVAFSLVSFMGQPAQEALADETATEETADIDTVSEETLTCDAKFVQVGSDNANYKVDAAFETKIAAAMAASGNISEAAKTVLLENSANNAHRLAIWTDAFDLYEDPNNWSSLVIDNCLSAEGQALYNKFDGALSAKGTTFELVDAPADAYNSGVSDGIFGVAATPGITGNRQAVKVTLPDGSVVYFMVRCGNVVYPDKPDVPDVPTDNPPPTTTPKSSDTTDYRQPGDSGKGADVGTGTKPATTTTTPVETAAPAVATSVTGGGGAVDSSTANAPDSEAGVAAAGADPAPATASPTPVNEGGSNDGVVGGGP